MMYYSVNIPKLFACIYNAFTCCCIRQR